MTRLTNHLRASIIDRMMEHAFSEKAVEMMRRQSEIAEQIYNDVYDRRAQERLNEAPVNWFPTVSGLKISIVGMSEFTKEFKFNGEFFRYSHNNTEAECWNVLSKEFRQRHDIVKKVPFKHSGSAIIKNYEPNHSIAFNAIQWINDQRLLSSQIVEARKLATSTMDNFTTVEKLIVGWPEIEPFTRNHQAPQPVKLPAIPFAKLNGMFGLPISE